MGAILLLPLPPALNRKGIDDATLLAVRQNRCARSAQVRDKIVNFGRLSIMHEYPANGSQWLTVRRALTLDYSTARLHSHLHFISSGYVSKGGNWAA
jgi:hypothetical protein